MNLQAIFDRVCEHAMVDHRKSLLPNSAVPRCGYRGAAGARCFIGCLIPDELYEPYVEGLSIATAATETSRHLLRAIGADASQLDQLEALQGVHDNYEPPAWLGRLRQYAGEHGLDTTVLQAAAERAGRV